MLKRILLRNIYSLANIAIGKSKSVNSFSMQGACALWTFGIVSCTARPCMLEIVVCWRSLGCFFLFSICRLEGFFYLCILAGALFIFDTLRFVSSRFACFGCDFLKCALLLRADFACEEYLALHSPQLTSCCVFLFFFIIWLNWTQTLQKHQETFEIVFGAHHSCVVSALSTHVPKHLPFFDTEK